MKKLQESQKKFYYNKFLQFHDDPRSLSWNSKLSQELRFTKILDLFKFEDYEKAFTIHEVGCGLGHFLEFLRETPFKYTYSGSDIIPEFIENNIKKYPGSSFYVQDISADYNEISKKIEKCDYFCLSGTFHTKEDNDLTEWESFVFKSIENMVLMSNKGICANFLTSYSDFYDEKLYYADPKRILDWAITNISRFVTITQDIPLYEFTVCIYKEEYMRSRFPGYEKYF